MSLRKSEIECQLNFLQKQVAICPAYLTLAYVRVASAYYEPGAISPTRI